jgi:hypothetical protein
MVGVMEYQVPYRRRGKSRKEKEAENEKGKRELKGRREHVGGGGGVLTCEGLGGKIPKVIPTIKFQRSWSCPRTMHGLLLQPEFDNDYWPMFDQTIRFLKLASSWVMCHTVVMTLVSAPMKLIQRMEEGIQQIIMCDDSTTRQPLVTMQHRRLIVWHLIGEYWACNPWHILKS